MPSLTRPLRVTPSPLKRWAMLAWLSACLLVAPMGALLHALSHAPQRSAAHNPAPLTASLTASLAAPSPSPDQFGDAHAFAQDDAHLQDKPDHCDLCQLWDLLDATLPAAFQWATITPLHLPTDAHQPASATVFTGNWFQSRAPPIQG